MNILFTLCGRAGSKGFQNKNLKTFIDVPLLYYSIAAVKLYMDQAITGKAKIDVVLNTDSEELISLALGQKAQKIEIIKRSAELGGDTVPKVAVIKDCLLQMEERSGIVYDMAVDLDITSPLRTVQDVKNAIEKKTARKDTIVVYSVTDSRRNPYFNMVRHEGDYFTKAIPSDYTARQQAPIFYDMNASIYAYDALAVKNCQDLAGFFNGKCDAILMKDTGILDIDSEEDFRLMQVIAEWIYRNDIGFREVAEEARRMKQ